MRFPEASRARKIPKMSNSTMVKIYQMRGVLNLDFIDAYSLVSASAVQHKYSNFQNHSIKSTLKHLNNFSTGYPQHTS
jgi:hypothetical protein